MSKDTIYRQDAIDAVNMGAFSAATIYGRTDKGSTALYETVRAIKALPSAQPDRLSNDDFETIRIHLNAYKESLCNQRRWKEAEEYQRLIDRFMAFASAQPETGKWDFIGYQQFQCTKCGVVYTQEQLEGLKQSDDDLFPNYCPNCGAKMQRGERDAEC